jgi:hypothetical protein
LTSDDEILLSEKGPEFPESKGPEFPELTAREDSESPKRKRGKILKARSVSEGRFWKPEA